MDGIKALGNKTRKEVATNRQGTIPVRRRMKLFTKCCTLSFFSEGTRRLLNRRKLSKSCL